MFKQSLFLAVLRIRNGLFRTRIQLYISILQYYRIHILEFTGLKVICSFIFGWIRNNNSGSGSRQKFRIHADPDPQHCKLTHRRGNRNILPITVLYTAFTTSSELFLAFFKTVPNTVPVCIHETCWSLLDASATICKPEIASQI